MFLSVNKQDIEKKELRLAEIEEEIRFMRNNMGNGFMKANTCVKLMEEKEELLEDIDILKRQLIKAKLKDLRK